MCTPALFVYAPEKELEREHKLGHKIVIWEDGEVKVVDP